MKTKIKVADNILINYTLIILCMVIALSTLLGVVISRYQEKHLFLTHIEFYPQLVNIVFEKNQELLQSITHYNMSDINALNADSLIKTILGIKGVDEVAILTTGGIVVASSIVNELSLDLSQNIQFNKALSGDTSYEYINKESSHTLKIYIPLKSDNIVVGVAYLVEGSGHIKSILHYNEITIWGVIALSGLLLYLLLFYIFYHSYRKQKTINIQLRQTQDVTIYALGYQAELRDLETGKHLERTSAYVSIIAHELKKNEHYKTYMSDDYVSDLIRSAPLHDIGKVAIPDRILLKNGKLNNEEFKVIQTHPLHGSDILINAEKRLSFPSFFKIAIQMCKYHHEKWNGKGYPSQLSGRNIPLSARIMTVADVYDALRSSRPYKDPFAHEKCIRIIKEESGISFDPEIVSIFLNKEKEFEEISIKMKD